MRFFLFLTYVFAFFFGYYGISFHAKLVYDLFIFKKRKKEKRQW